MKKHIKYFGIVLVFLTSLACSLPFLAGDSTADPIEITTPEIPTLEIPTLETPTPAEISSGLDSCLTGVWTMDTYALNNKFLDLTHSPNMFVVTPSFMTMEFNSDGSYLIYGETIVRSDIPNGSDFIQLPGTHAGEGSYSADGSSIVMTHSTYAVTFGTMIISINGETAESPVSSMSFPEDFMSPPPETTYLCSGRVLKIIYDGPFGSITEEWNR